MRLIDCTCNLGVKFLEQFNFFQATFDHLIQNTSHILFQHKAHVRFKFRTRSKLSLIATLLRMRFYLWFKILSKLIFRIRDQLSFGQKSRDISRYDLSLL